MALNLEQGGLSYHPHHPYALHGGLDAPTLVPQQAGRRPAAAATMQRPPLPVPPVAAQHKPPAVNSCLTHSLQAGRHAAGVTSGAAQPMGMSACTAQAAPLPAPPLAPSLGFPFPPQQPALPPAAMYASSWHAAAYAQQQQQAAAYSLAAGMAVGGAPGAGGHSSMLAPGGHTVAAGWPTLQPHAGPYSLFPAQAAQAQAGLSLLPQQQAGAAACGGTAARRRTRRRPTARRSLLDLFDAAAASEEASEYDSMEDSDSECDIMQLCSQESAASSSIMPFPSSAARTPAPRTPFSQDQSSQSSLTPPAAHGCTQEGSPSSSPSPTDTPSTPQAGAAAAADDHMLPLQHLLMSERAAHLTALEVKAIIFKVAADLAALHDAGVLHRHVTIASVALARTGNLATARLMGHPYNVEAGQTRRYTGGKKAGVDAYLAPELARCPADCVSYTPAGDIWSLGVVLFVLLSGSHVPFGNRGLCWTTVPNMPGLKDSVDKLQKWLKKHLDCKVDVINKLRASQDKGKAPLGTGPEMRVVGVDDDACDLLKRLLAADPAARPSARQVLSHPWLAEVDGLVAGASKASAAPPAARLMPGRPPSPEELAAAGMSPGFEAQLRRTASDLAHLGFSPATPSEDVAPVLPPLHRGASDLSTTSTDCHFEFGFAGPSCNTSAHASCADLTEAFAAAAPAGGSVHSGRAAAAAQQAQQAQQAAHEPRPAAVPATDPSASFAFVLQDGTALQLLSHEAAASLVVSGALPDASAGSSWRAAQTFPPIGFAVHPTGATVEGQSTPMSAIYVVYNVEGQAMLAAKPIAVTQLPGPAAERSSAATHKVAPAAAPHASSQAAPARPPPPAPHANPDLGTSAPILPMLARMLQQQQQQQ